MKPRPHTPALWVLRSRRRPSNTADPVEAERRKAYEAMDPGERLARALALSSRAPRLSLLNRSIRVHIPAGSETSVMALEDLIVLKLMAGGSGDLADVADLLERAGSLPDLEKRASERGVSELLRQVRASIGNS